jgi:GNAT superfamily N-acetyltransferase
LGEDQRVACEVRQLVGEEWELLRSVRLSALLDSPTSLAESGEASESWPELAWRNWSTDAAVFLALAAAGKPIGMVSSAKREAVGDRGLAAMWVAPHRRRSAVATDLLATFLRWAYADGVNE